MRRGGGKREEQAAGSGSRRRQIGGDGTLSHMLCCSVTQLIHHCQGLKGPRV